MEFETFISELPPAQMAERSAPWVPKKQLSTLTLALPAEMTAAPWPEKSSPPRPKAPKAEFLMVTSPPPT